MAWNCKPTGAYSRESAEALNNARNAYAILSSRGWTLAAFSAMWGNVEHESGYNPWRWQSDSVQYSDSPNINIQSGHAYGLVQWDPAAKYITGGRNYSGYAPNFADRSGAVSDGSAQLNFLDDTAVSSGQYITSSAYPINYAAFKAATTDQYTIDWLTRAWFRNYERGTWSDSRSAAAAYWYETLSGETPHGKIPIWLMFKLKERNSHV